MPEGAKGVPVLLASASPYRRKMLQDAGLSFDVVTASVDEAALKREFLARTPKPSAGAIASALAQAKAEAVSRTRRDALVIGADQVLIAGDDLLDKPGSAAAARAQLARLRGKTHRLISAVSLAQAGAALWTHVNEANLTMRAFSDTVLDGYVAEAGERLAGIVGAYEIEGRGIQLFERVEGDHFTIIGLPLVPLLAELRSRGVMAS
jgi:septum formation protein